MTEEQDLRTRWAPSPSQDAEAARTIRLWDTDAVYTTHLLLNKDRGFWTADVEIVHLTAVHLTRQQALAAAETAEEVYRHCNPTKAVSVGYTAHWPLKPDKQPSTSDGSTWQTTWAVFEA